MMNSTTCEDLQKHECANCTTSQTTPNAKEKGREYRFQNKSRKQVCQIKIDGCYITSQEKKCDFLYIVGECEDWYFIELKGSHLLKAVEQITQTLDYFNSYVMGRVFARIVVTKVSHPKSIENDARIRNLRKRLKELGGDLIYTSRLYEEVI